MIWKIFNSLDFNVRPAFFTLDPFQTSQDIIEEMMSVDNRGFVLSQYLRTNLLDIIESVQQQG